MNTNYYKLLKEKYPSKESVLTQIIKLKSYLTLPKGTEHFMSDLHGEYTAFNHVMRNGSGSIKEKLRDYFGNRYDVDIDDLSVLIYYPTDKINYERSRRSDSDLKHWLANSLNYLVEIAIYCSHKYTRSHVRSLMPDEYAFIMEELIYEQNPKESKRDYYHTIIKSAIDLNQGANIIRAFCILIQELVVEHLHIVGDIYDRGPEPDKIVDRLMQTPSLDIQWGNHDIIWMGAIAGSPTCMMAVIRIQARYGNLDVLEDAYGINLRPMIDFAIKNYQPSDKFKPKIYNDHVPQEEQDRLNVLQQASAIMQFKLEGQIYERRSEFEMDHRNLLTMIDYSDLTIDLDGVSYQLENFNPVTIDPNDPNKLSDEEKFIINKTLQSFQNSKRLKEHVNFLLDKGSLYLIYNDNLMTHGCIPLDEDGEFSSLTFEGVSYSGKSLMDFFQEQVFDSFKEPNRGDDFATDCLWYLWCGEKSCLFGKNAMATFERYYISDKTTHVEVKNDYYNLRSQKELCYKILDEFDMPRDGRIINGHTPVKEKDGESPILADGQMFVIDGGFSKAYQNTTGIAGYTLLYNSWGMQLVSHQSFQGVDDAVKNRKDVVSTKRIVDVVDRRVRVSETTKGRQLQEEIDDLTYLYENYERV